MDIDVTAEVAAAVAAAEATLDAMIATLNQIKADLHSTDLLTVRNAGAKTELLRTCFNQAVR